MGSKTGLVTLVVHAVNVITRCGGLPFRAAVNQKYPPGGVRPQVETQGIDGARQAVEYWNSKQREEPYQVLTSVHSVEIHEVFDTETGGGWCRHSCREIVGKSRNERNPYG